MILSENRCTRNLLTGKDTSQEKIAFESPNMRVVRATSAQISNPSRIRYQQKRSKEKIEKFIFKIEKAYLFLDLERSAGPCDSEVLQVAVISGRGPERKTFNKFVKPQGGVDPGGASNSHQMRLVKGNLVDRNRVPLPTVTAADCITDLLAFLHEISTSSGRDLTLVTYGDSDLPNIANFLDYHNKLEDFLQLVPYHIDFQTVTKMDCLIQEKTRGKIGLANMCEETSIVKLITGNLPSSQKVHDALYDASILHQIFFTYLKNGTFFKETFSSFRENSVTKINPGAIQRSLVKMRRRRVVKKNPHNIFYPAGLTRW